MRDYSKIDKFLDRLGTDIYPQPQDDGHSSLAVESIQALMPMTEHVHSVLDLGCGEGFCQDFFSEYEYTGVSLHKDYDVAVSKGRNVFNMDYSFLPFEDDSYDFLYSRHSLEHSPMPLLTLMEWHRITKRYLAVILPAPEFWRFSGKNHYFVLNRRQWENLFDVAGFSVTYKNVKKMKMFKDENAGISTIEYWYLLEKK